MPSIRDRLIHAWNAFTNKDPPNNYANLGPSSSYRPDRTRLSHGNARSIVTAIYNRIGIDVASVNIEHVDLDENGRFIRSRVSGLNDCLKVAANLDQTGRAFMQDAVVSMLDEGVVALVPVDTSVSIRNENTFDILSMRVGKVVEWYPQSVKVNLYNQKTGRKEDITLPKRSVSIVQNPFFAVMNETNSTLQRLIHKLALLDAVDEQSSAGKLDMVIQLPYAIKGETRQQQAQKRRQDIENQLNGSKYGIAYIDGTQKITQLNRPISNNLMQQIEYLTKQLYGQLGMCEQIFNGTADDKTMLNYYNRCIQPIVSAFVLEMRRKWLTKTARTQRQSIIFWKDPFQLVSIDKIADIADKFTRNEVLTSNEVRQIIGYKPSDNPRADELVNKNMPAEDVGGEYAEPMEQLQAPQEQREDNYDEYEEDV